MTLTAIISNWRVRSEDDLPDVPPGGSYARLIVPQKFVVLCRVVVHDLTLVRLRIGAINDVPFELESADGCRRTYRPKELDADLKKRLVATGAAPAPQGTIALVPGLEVRMQLRNEGTAPAKPRSALIVLEEIS